MAKLRSRLRSVGSACAISFLLVAGMVSPVDAGSRASADWAPLRLKIEDDVRAQHYPGAVYALARGDEVLDVEAVGIASRSTGSPMRADSIFRMMSMTKGVTAVAAMILVDEGKLKLDDPVSTVLPAFRNFGPPGSPPLTLRHLLTHTSGIGFGAIPSVASPLAQRADEAASRPRTVRVGSQWAYSGIEGPDIVARMIEVTSGEPFEQFARQRIFEPLKMSDTGWSLTDQQRRRLVDLDALDNGAIVGVPAAMALPEQPSGGYGLYSTAPDFLRLAQMLAGNGRLGRVRILSPRAVEQIRAAQVRMGFPGLPPGLEFGLLMRRVGDPALAKSPLAIGSFGWSGAYGTHFWIDPATGFSAVWMINMATAGGASSPDALAFETMVVRACRTNRRCAVR